MIVTSIQLWITKERTSQKNMEPLTGQGEAQVGGAFTLTDHTGKIVRDTDFQGKILLVYFGFTQCPDVCPATLMTLTKTMALLGDKADQVTPLFISVDPGRDTPEVLANFLSNFDKHIIGLTGTPEQIKQVEETYKVYAAKKETPKTPQDAAKFEDTSADYSVDHSSYLYIMDRDGKFLTVMPSDAKPQEISNTISRYLGQ